MKTLADELNDALARQHILEGRQIALLRRDELLYWISSSDDAIKKLMLELNLTDIQAKDILSLNLGYFKRLVALDVESELLDLQRNLSSNANRLPIPPKRENNQISIESYDNPFFKEIKENE